MSKKINKKNLEKLKQYQVQLQQSAQFMKEVSIESQKPALSRKIEMFTKMIEQNLQQGKPTDLK